MFWTLPLLIGGSYAVWWLIQSFLERRNRARLAAEWGCGDVKHVPGYYKYPFGFSPIAEFVRNGNANRIPLWFIEFYKRALPAHTFSHEFPQGSTLLTAEPANIQALLATQFKDFETGDRSHGLNPLFGPGIFTQDGESWKHSRAMLRPQFARDQVADLQVEEHHMQELIGQIAVKDDGTTEVVDMRPLFFRLSLDSSTEFLFGESCQSQTLSNSPDRSAAPSGVDPVEFSNAFDRGTAFTSIRVFLGDLCWLYNPKQYKTDTKTVHDFADYYVKKGLAKADEKSSTEKQKYVFLDELVQVTRDPIELRNQLLNILLAGRDTTSGTLGWIFYVLARHPTVYAKLRSTVLQHFGTYSSPTDTIDFASLKSCNYLQYVMNEVLRLYPAVPGNIRTATRHTTLPAGGGTDGKRPVFVHKGQKVAYHVHVMHRRKDIWGEDADEFKPERWEGRKSGFEYVPFNAGPRICLGQQHALTLMGFAVVRLVQRFEGLEVADGGAEERHTVGLTTTPTECLVRFKVAK